MRRLLPLAAGLAALTLTTPGVALANHGHHHHHRHKTKHHHVKVRFEHIGVTDSAPPTGTVPPPAPTGNAGKVASYTGGILTLTLADGSTVSGKVTNRTRIRCVSATPPTGLGNGGRHGEDDGPGTNNGPGDDDGPGANNGPGNGPGDGDQNDGGPRGADEPPCDSSALVLGAIVRSAKLRIDPVGTEFECIELVR